MFIDTNKLEDNAEIETDLCIVGGGAAGIALAREFLSSKTNVCILEGGDQGYRSASQSLYHGFNIGLPYFSLMSCRLRFFGGTTNHWGGYCRNYRPLDFQKRDWIPYSGWPISYEDISPYYDRAADLLGLPQEIWNVEALENAIGEPKLPFNADRLRTKSAIIKPVRMAELVRNEFKDSDSVRVFLNANVTHLQCDSEAKRIISLNASTLTGKRMVLKAREYVVAAGGIENPRILLLSNDVAKAGLGNQNDLVGRFFMDHTRFNAGVIQPADPHRSVRLYDRHDLSGVSTSVTVSVADAAQKRLRISANGFKFRGVPDKDSMQSTLLRYWQKAMDMVDSSTQDGESQICASDVSDLLLGLAGKDPSIESRLRDAVPTSRIVCSMRIDPVPNPSSRVTLSDKKDNLGLRRINLDWRLTKLDLENAKKSIELLGQEVGRSNVGRFRSLVHEKQDWEEFLGTDTFLQANWHHMGTTRMADSAQKGVVDRDCKVHGISNLFIGGSSVFPTAGSGTPTLTIIALAIRLADHLKQVQRT